MRRKMLLFSPSLLAETLWLWCSSSRAALFELFFLNTRCSYCDKWFSTVPNNSRGTQTYPSSNSSSSTNYTMSTLDCAGGCLSCQHTRLRAIFVCLPFYPDGNWQTLEDTAGRFPLAAFLAITPLLYTFPALLFISAAHFTSRFLLPALCSAPVRSFVSLSPVSDSKQGLIHVQCLHLFLPSNLCCQEFPSVWMARLSCVCKAVSWGVDTFLRVQHETDCSR